jgi:REP element-mobilizing transposase RayT
MAGTSYPPRRHPRLTTYDYATAGYYFVTLCSQPRLPLLGRISGGVMQLSPAREMVRESWQAIPTHHPGIAVDAVIVMPDHLHGIVVIQDAAEPEDAPPLSLPAVMQRFKALTTTRYITGVREEGWPPFPGQLWQTSFFERVIRGERELDQARRYIADNPQQWALDRENPDRWR